MQHHRSLVGREHRALEAGRQGLVLGDLGKGGVGSGESGGGGGGRWWWWGGGATGRASLGRRGRFGGDQYPWYRYQAAPPLISSPPPPSGRQRTAGGSLYPPTDHDPPKDDPGRQLARLLRVGLRQQRAEGPASQASSQPSLALLQRCSTLPPAGAPGSSG